MPTLNPSPFEVVYLNSDGSFVSGYKAEEDAPRFKDYGSYLIPFEFGEWDI